MIVYVFSLLNRVINISNNIYSTIKKGIYAGMESQKPDIWVFLQKNSIPWITKSNVHGILSFSPDTNVFYNTWELGNQIKRGLDDVVTAEIIDSDGNMIASTQTINGYFGSGVVAKGTGIVLNNEMDDFAQKIGAKNLFGAVGGEFNLIAPRKRPLSSMSPTIITNDGEAFMALGSPSGTRIITCVAQTILNAVEFEMPLYEAVAATRIHQQWQPDVLKIESPFLDPKVEQKLKKKGHNIVHDKLGCSIQAIKKLKNGWHGVSDPRGKGLALGID
jgi:gamma-glutamyltranspeptidase/glutathione hydrolase